MMIEQQDLMVTGIGECAYTAPTDLRSASHAAARFFVSDDQRIRLDVEIRTVKVWQTDVSFASPEASQTPATFDRRFEIPDFLTAVGFEAGSVASSQSTPSRSLFDSEEFIVRGQNGGSGGGGLELVLRLTPACH